MAEWFREVYNLDKLQVKSGYIVKDFDTHKVTGVALNLERDDEFGSGGQLVLNLNEVQLVSAIINQLKEDIRG